MKPVDSILIRRAPSLVRGLVALCVLTASALAVAAEPVDIDLPAQSLERSLKAVASLQKLQMVYVQADVAGVDAKPLKGHFTAEEAIGRLTEGTRLIASFDGKSTVVIKPRPSASDAQDPHTSHAAQGASSIRMAQADAATGAGDGNVVSGVAEGSEAKSGGLEEIIVTAGKRNERLQDTPMSLSALSGRDIHEQGLRGMADYLNSLPGVSHLDQGVGRNATVIRGISLDPESEGLSSGQTVGVYFGEVPLSGLRWSAPDLKLVDMERVEVLRGPQGTLYGSGSLSGAIRNIPVAPNPRAFEGEVEAGYSNTARDGGSGNQIRGMINLPLSEDRFALRAVGYRFHDSGYVKNVAGSDPATLAIATAWGVRSLAIDQDDVGNADYIGGRVAALWQVTDQLSATLTYLGQNVKQEGLPEVDLPRGSYTQARLQMAPVIGGGRERLIDNTDVTNLVVSYELAALSLVSSTSYSQQLFHRKYDIAAFFGGMPAPQIYRTVAEGFSEELRAVSHLEGPFQFVGGLYYESLDFSTLSQTFFGGAPELNAFGNALWYDFSDETKLRQKAVFGELSYQLTSQWKLTAGARRFDYDRETHSLGGGAALPGTSDTLIGGDEGGTSYKANVSFTPMQGAMLYAQWSQGFRLGRALDQLPATCDVDNDGFVDGVSGVPRVGARLKSDSLDSYELGGKLTLLESRLIINAAAYRIDWTDLPVSVIPPSPCLTPVSLNAGKARSNGAEIESLFLITPQLRVNVAASLVRAELLGDTPSIGSDGERLPGSPREQYSAGLQYSFNVADHPAFIHGDYAYVGSFYNQPGERGGQAGGYGLVNARFGVTLDRVELALYGNNLTNSDAVSWADSVFPDGRGFRLRPRTFGMNATLRF